MVYWFTFRLIILAMPMHRHMLPSFRQNIGARFAKFANVAALVSFLASVWALVYLLGGAVSTTPVFAAEALETVSSTLAQPIYSASTSTPTYTNIEVNWTQTKAFTVMSGDPCQTNNRCFEFIIDLQSTGNTSTEQQFTSTTVTGDVTWNGPAGSTLTGVYANVTHGQSIPDQLVLYVDCAAGCSFATSTPYSFTIANYPIINPQQPVGYVAGTYTSLTQGMTAVDDSVSNQQDESKTAIVAIGKGITVTASVTPTLTFTVTGKPGSTPFYTDSSDIDTSGNPDACDFGTLTPGTPKVCLFNLEINTNASNGYSIYVVQDQDMTFNGNTIKQYKSGTRVDDSAADQWTAPTGASYGHLGYSSDDTSVFAVTTTAAIWAGIPNIATSAQAPVITGLVADSAAPGDDNYTYALKIESAATLPQGTGYTHHEYFIVVGNF